jgi:hypothetical protein
VCCARTDFPPHRPPPAPRICLAISACPPCPHIDGKCNAIPTCSPVPSHATARCRLNCAVVCKPQPKPRPPVPVRTAQDKTGPVFAPPSRLQHRPPPKAHPLPRRRLCALPDLTIDLSLASATALPPCYRERRLPRNGFKSMCPPTPQQPLAAVKANRCHSSSGNTSWW